MYTFKSYLFIDGKNVHTLNMTNLVIIQYTYIYDTDYQIQSRNKIELRKSSKYYVIYHSLLLFDMIRWLLVYAVYL